jgi:hypothetical protein
MFYVVPDTLLEVLSTNYVIPDTLLKVFNATFNNVSYSIEHRDQFFWCLTTLSTMCQ